MGLEKLERPPIIEVACGVVFETIGEIDPLTLGAYRQAKLADFPAHQLHPPIIDGTFQFVGALPPIRSWLVSADDSWIIQVQFDRFYLNWRSRGANYPRFSNHQNQAGVLSKFLSEFQIFSTFCQQSYDVGVSVKGIELTKIDYLEKGRSWTDSSDLSTMMPSLSPLLGIANGKDPMLTLQFREEMDGGVVTASVEIAQHVKIETRLQKAVKNDLRGEFENANNAINEVFAKLIPKEQRSLRFQKENA